MSFLLVDRITTFESGKRVEGVKHISASEPYLTRMAGSDRPTFISSLIGEAVGQLAAWSVMHALDFKKRPVAGIVSKGNIFDDVHIGDTLRLSATIDALDGEAVEYHGAAYVGDRKVFEIESAIGPMMAMAEMNLEKEVRAQFNQILSLDDAFSFGDVESECVDDFQAELEQAAQANVVDSFDKLLEMNQAGETIAEKLVSQSAPYFIDHFPLKPVLPLTILLSCKIQLVFYYLKRYFPSETFCVRSVRKIKMGQFVSPGEVLQTKMKVKQKDGQTLFQFKSFVAQKRVCVCEVIVEQGEPSE